MEINEKWQEVCFSRKKGTIRKLQIGVILTLSSNFNCLLINWAKGERLRSLITVKALMFNH